MRRLALPLAALIVTALHAQTPTFDVRLTHARIVDGPVISGASETATAQHEYQRGQYTLDPTPLEALAASRDAQTTWSKYVGRLDGGDNFAMITAVSIRSVSSPGTGLRGVRIDLRHDGPARNCGLIMTEWVVMCEREQAAAFIEEDRLDAVRTAVRRGSAEVHPGHPSGITNFSSSAGAWGVLLCGYGLQGRTLDEVAAMLDTAAELLKTAPR